MCLDHWTNKRGIICKALDQLRDTWWPVAGQMPVTWTLRRQEAVGLDPMAVTTGRSLAEIEPGAVVAARRYLAAADADLGRQASEASPAELLRRLGVLRPDDALTQAGVLLFCPAPTTLISLSRIDVPGGAVIGPPVDLSGLALIEQFAMVERSLEAVNQTRTVPRGLAHLPVRQLPPSAVREAVLNGLIHRDWIQPDPVTITWYEHDSTLEVISPGGSVGGVTSGNVLTQRYARYPALSDLFRALRLVDKQGIGVDRMYRDMAALGHRPPQITEEPGPRVRTRLVGGDPVVPVMTLVDATPARLPPPGRAGRCDHLPAAPRATADRRPHGRTAAVHRGRSGAGAGDRGRHDRGWAAVDRAVPGRMAAVHRSAPDRRGSSRRRPAAPARAPGLSATGG